MQWFALTFQSLQYFAAGAAGNGACTEHTFLGLPTWYHYLLAAGKMAQSASSGGCEFVTVSHGFSIQDMSLVGLALVDILLRVAAFVAIGFVIYGGFSFITAQGEPENVKHAQSTIFNALIGLGISIGSVGAVAFIAKFVGG